MKKEFGKEYATALFDLSLENKNIDTIYEQLIIASNTITSDESFVKLLSHPQVNKDNKKDIIKNVYNKFDNVLVNFLYVLIDNDRIEELSNINEQFIKMYNEYIQVIIVEAHTTIALTSEQKEKLINKLTLKYKHKIEINNIIDPTIFGGMRLLVNDEIIDFSIKTQLSQLKSHVLKQN